jgi:hypothetical protein
MKDIKLHVEIDGKVLDIEGDSDMVDRVFKDFKEQVVEERDGKPQGGIGGNGMARPGNFQGSHDVSDQDIAPLVAMTHTPEIEKRLIRELQQTSNR